MLKLKVIRQDFIVFFLLILITSAIFWQVQSFDFVRYDDDLYVTHNSHVQAGLTKDGVIWAFTSVHANNWHPLTWLSHMIDFQIYGSNPAGHHLTNVFLHILNTLLLFIVLKRMTKFFWQSAFVAALFAIHPLHIESVAWVAERKDVLSTLFWMLTLWSYVRYAEHPGIYRYIPILLFFTLGLMSKPMVITMPFVMLLLDYWPLGRVQLGKSFVHKSDNAKVVETGGKKRFGTWIILEKIPLLILSGASICVTLFAQWSGIATLHSFPFSSRIGNSLVSYISYMGKMIWPQNLSVFYPYSEKIPQWQIGGSALLLVLITLFAVRLIRRYPYVMIGWLWYLGTLVPVIGLVQVGLQSMADRYTYIPMIGLFIIVAWIVPDILARWRFHRLVVPVLASCVVGALMIVTVFQLQHWQNSITLFSHALNVTKNNYVIHSNMGASLAEQGKVSEAILHYEEALRIKPDDFDAHYNLANSLVRSGDLQNAISHYDTALRIQPNESALHNNMGIALSQLGKTNEAIMHFREAVRIKPDYDDAQYNLEMALTRQEKAKKEIPGKADMQIVDPKSAEGQMKIGLSLVQKGNLDEAIPKFQEALRLNPRLVAAHISLGLIMAQKRDLDKAIDYFRKALQIKPDLPEAHNSLGVALTYKGALDEAILHFKEALRINKKFAKAHNSLAVALAQKGKTEEAIYHLRQALQIKPDYEEAKRNLNIMLNTRGKSS